jgi:hypothetical protein
MSVEEAVAILKVMDMKSLDRFSDKEREAVTTLGVMGWSGDLEPTDPRLLDLPAETQNIVKKIVAVMQTKRIIQ